MQEREAESTPGPVTPAGSAPIPPVPKFGPVDRVPKDPEEWRAFAKLPAADRSAAYLRSIRAMMLFFTVLTVLGLIAGVVLALIGIHAINQANTPTQVNPFG